jgi:hypothetical protein
MRGDRPIVAHVRAELAACRAALASGQIVSGQAAPWLILPPADEDPNVAERIALYERWLARWAPASVEESDHA